MKNKVITVITVISFFAFLFYSNFYMKKKEVNLEIKLQEKELEEAISIDNTFDCSALKCLIFNLEIKYPDIVFAQALLESGLFKSGLFLENNNLFGMKKARARATTSKIADSGFSRYNTWQESVIDYALFQSYYISRVKSEKEYLQLLGRIYAEDKKYVEKLKRLMSCQL